MIPDRRITVPSGAGMLEIPMVHEDRMGGDGDEFQIHYIGNHPFPFRRNVQIIMGTFRYPGPVVWA